MAGNGVNVGIGIDYSQFEKDLSIVNKQLKSIAEQKRIISLKVNFAKTQNASGKEIASEIEKSFKAAQKELLGALNNVEKIQIGGKHLIDPNSVNAIKDAEKAMKALNKELSIEQSKASPNNNIINQRKAEIAQLNQYISALGRMSDVMAKAGLASTPKASAINKQERAEIDKQIKLLEKKRAILKQNSSINSRDKLNEEKKIIGQIIALLEKRERTYKSGSSKAGQDKIAALKLEQAQLKQQGSLLSSLRGMASRYLSVYAAFNVVKEIFNVTKELDRQKVALEGIVGSAAAATKAMNGLKQMALESPFNLKELIGYTKQLSAYGIEVKELLPTTHKLADLSAGLGVDMSRLILAYGQVNAASVLRGQELRQFTEAGIPMVEELAKKFTELNGRLVTTGEVFDLISKRQVSFEMVSQVLTDMTSEGGKFYKMQENLTKTLYGQFEKLKDIWTISMKSVGSDMEPIFRRVLDLAMRLSKSLKGVLYGVLVGGIIKGLQAIKISFTSIVGLTKSFWKNLVAAKAAGNGLSFAMASINRAMKSNAFIAVLSTVVGLITNIISKSKEWKKQLDEIDTSFRNDLAKDITGFDNLLNKLSSTTEGTKAYNDAMETLKMNYGEFVNDDLINQLIRERKQLDNTTEGWNLLYESIIAAMRAKNDYAYHVERRTAASDAIKQSFSDIFDAGNIIDQYYDLLNSRYANASVNFDFSGAEAYREQASEAYLAKSQKDLYATAANNAVDLFFENGETTLEELQNRIKDELRFFNLSGATAEHFSTSVANDIFRMLQSDSKWEVYANEAARLINDPYRFIDDTFADAKRNASFYQEGRWTPGMRNVDYNPFALQIAEDFELSKAASQIIGSITSNMTRDMIAYERSNDPIIEEQNKREGLNKYNLAAREINNLFANMRLIDFNDAGFTRTIAEKMNNLLNTIGDPSLHAQVRETIDKYMQLAGTSTDRAANVASNIINAYGEGSDADREMKDFMSRYVPTDQSFDENRTSISNRISQLESEIRSYGDTQNETNSRYVEGLRRELSWFKILAGDDYYDIDLTEDTATPRSNALNIDAGIAELIDSLKNAYQRYTEAVQKGGIEAGIGYTRTDEQFNEMFGQFFNSAGGELLNEKYRDLQIGEKSVLDLLRDKFITEGLEEGILNFESAALSIANELEDYYEGDTENRRDYLRASKDLKKWIYSTISKDNLSAALAEFEQGLKGVTQTLESTNKNIETYRKLVQQGTASQLAGALGINDQDIFTPQSQRQRGIVSRYVEGYNQALEKFDGTTPYQLDVNNLLTPDDVLKAIAKIDEVKRMNAGNFDATELGEQGDKLKDLLLKLADSMRKEIEGISGKSVLGGVMGNARENAFMNAFATMFNVQEKQNTAMAHGMIDGTAIENLLKMSQEQSTSFLEAFLKSEKGAMAADMLSNGINKDDFLKKFDEEIEKLKKVFSDAGEEFPATLEFELKQKRKELGEKIDTFNSEGGKLGIGEDFRRYKEAKAKSKEDYDNTLKAREYAVAELTIAEIDAKHLKKSIDSGTATDQEKEKYQILISDIATLNAQLVQYDNHLTAIGENGSLDEQVRKMQALANIQTKLNSFSNGVSQIQDAALSVVDSIQSTIDVFAKFNDILSDGENPEWLITLQEGISDFTENFKAAIAPILAVVGAIVAVIVVVNTLTTACAALGIAATPLFIVMAAVVAVAAILAGVTAAIQARDNKLEHSIEDLSKQTEDFRTEIDNLNAEANRMSGLEKIKTQINAIGKSLSIATAEAEKARLEEEKKNTDEDKVKEYEQAYREAMNEFHDGLKSILDDIVGSTEDWSSAMASALRSAFQNGENAARAFRSSIKEMMGDIVEQMLNLAVLQPVLEGILQEWTENEFLKKKHTKTIKENGIDKTVFDYEAYYKDLMRNISDPDKAEEAYRQMISLGDSTIDWIEQLPDYWKDAFKYTSDTSSLSGGISGITEDTARQLEGLQNSMLMQLIQINGLLNRYLETARYDYSPYMTSINSHLSTINSNVAAILSHIDSLRNTPSLPIHVTVV